MKRQKYNIQQKLKTLKRPNLRLDVYKFYLANKHLRQWQIAEIFQISQSVVSEAISSQLVIPKKVKKPVDPVSLQGEGTYTYTCTKPDCFFCKALDF